MGGRSLAYDPSRASLYSPGQADNFFLPSRSWNDAALGAELSRLAYCDDAPRRHRSLARVALEERDFLDIDGTQVLVAVDGARAFIAFRGTDDLRAFVGNLSLLPVAWEKGGRVHAGFAQYLDKVREPLTPIVETLEGRDLVFTGHSLGAAAAVLAASLWPKGRVYAFGLPRVGDAAFAATLAGDRVHRYVDCCDRVCRVPPEALGYVHVGRLHYIDRNGILSEMPDADQIKADQRAGSWAYLRQYAWAFWKNVVTRDLADHAPINYVVPL